MNFIFSAINRRPSEASGQRLTLQADVHAHVLPGLHAGVDSLNQSIRLLRMLSACGLNKVVSTMHIMEEYYHNTAQSILEVSREVQSEARLNRLPVEVIPAAQYYIDRGLLRLLYNQSFLLTFSDRLRRQYLLFDTNLVKMPAELENVLAAFRSRSIHPIMTHPEQYIYLQKKPEYAFRLKELGVLFQINLPSLAGKPNEEARRLAEWLIDQGLVSFLGSNLSQDYQLAHVQYAMTTRHYQKALEKGVRNNLL